MRSLWFTVKNPCILEWDLAKIRLISMKYLNFNGNLSENGFTLNLQRYDHSTC